MAELKVNAQGLQCPAPIMRLFLKIKEAQPGDVVLVEATDCGFKSDIAAWCAKTKNELLSLTEAEGIITARIRKV